MIRPLAAGGFEVFFVSRWLDMDPATTFADVAERHAAAIVDKFGGPVPVIGHSTGGLLLLQLVADRPDVVTRAVVASAAYALGPVAKRAQRELMQAVERTGRYSGVAIASGMPASSAARRSPAGRAAGAGRLPIRVAHPVDAVTMLQADESRTAWAYARSPPRPWSRTALTTTSGRWRWWPRRRIGCRGPG